MKKFFTGILTLFLTTAVSAGYLCQGFSSEKDCHQDAYRDILKTLRGDVQSPKSSVSPEKYVEKISDRLPYNTFASIFQKSDSECKAYIKKRDSGIECLGFNTATLR